MSEKISIREFGRRVNKSDTTVRKAIDAGWISKAVSYRDSGRPELDAEVALQEWNESPAGLQAEVKNLTSTSNYQPKKNKSETSEIKEPAAPATDNNKTKTNYFDPETLASKKEIVKTRQQSAVIDTQRKAIELKKIMGLLVDKENVYKSLFNFGQTLRKNFHAIPDRFIDQIRNSKSRNEAHSILVMAIDEALEDLTKIPSL